MQLKKSGSGRGDLPREEHSSVLLPVCCLLPDGQPLCVCVCAIWTEQVYLVLYMCINMHAIIISKK